MSDEQRRVLESVIVVIDGYNESMVRTRKLALWLTLGIVVMLTPCLGTIPLMLKMVAAINNPDQPVGLLQPAVQRGLWLMMAGYVLCPFGFITVVVVAIKLWRIKNGESGNAV